MATPFIQGRLQKKRQHPPHPLHSPTANVEKEKRRRRRRPASGFDPVAAQTRLVGAVKRLLHIKGILVGSTREGVLVSENVA